jgi:hypothetical protein
MGSGSEQQSWSLSTDFQMVFKPGLFAGPLKDFHILVLKPFQHFFGCIRRVIVLSECKSLPQSKVVFTLKQVLIKDLPIFGSIHCSL